ncbi:MAG: DUF4238 domain-containing protein [Methylococcaceae bacterium]
MATNKNQHFVHRGYLRPFTIDEANAAINLYNIDRQKFIPLAPVKNQCSRDYFYGQDESLERAIRSVEDGYTTALHEILKPSYVLTNEHRTILRTFWLFQYLRTEAAAIKSVEMMSSISDVAGIQDPSFKLTIKDAVIIAMRTFGRAMHVIDDLKICLVRNKTQTPFFTSDDPAVLTNRWWLTDQRTQGRSFGVGSAGVIILLPLSPKLLCIGYDGDVYSIPHNQGLIEVHKERDIASFNQHQILNCRANLFVQRAEHSNVVHKAYMETAKNRLTIRHEVNYAIHDGNEGEYVRYRTVDSKTCEEHTEALIHIKAVNSIPLFWPKQIAFRNKGKVFTNGTGLGYIRHAGTDRSTQLRFYKESA